MSVKVHLYSGLQKYTNGQDVVEVSGNTIGECLNDLVKRFPKTRQALFDKQGKLFPEIFVSINLKSVYPEELSMPVKDGDELYIVLIVAGG